MRCLPDMRNYTVNLGEYHNPTQKRPQIDFPCLHLITTRWSAGGVFVLTASSMEARTYIHTAGFQTVY